MAVFFIEWELWQEMTFVLACCIVLVFATGFIKLWWTNRALRRLEAVDEEKRARVLEIRQCGLDTWAAADDIPFGVRAIQSGVEVDGIWISRPACDADASHVASSATLVGEPSAPAKSNASWQDTSSADGFGKRPHYASENSTIDQTLCANPLLPPGSPVLVALDTPPSDDAPHRPDQRAPRHNPEASSYVPTGMHHGPRRTDAAGTERPSRYGAPPSAARPAAADQRHRPVANPLHHGAAAVYANRDTRRTNGGFEILPAGTLAPRQEFSAPPGSDVPEAGAGGPQLKQRPNKLRKKPPPDRRRNSG